MTDTSKHPVRTTLAGLTQDGYLGLGIILFGILLLLWIIPAQVNDAGSFGLPPSLAPKSLAWVMIACGVALIIQNLRSARFTEGIRASELVFMLSCLFAIGLMLVLMAYSGEWLDRPNAGFLLAAPLGLLLFTFLHSRAPLWAYIFNATVVPLVIVAAFWWGLELPLP